MLGSCPVYAHHSCVIGFTYYCVDHRYVTAIKVDKDNWVVLLSRIAGVGTQKLM